MSEYQSLATRHALRQTADLAPLSPRYFPVSLGATWVYRCLSQHVADGVSESTVTEEQERVAGVMPALSPSGTDGWSVTIAHEILSADRTSDCFTTDLLVQETAVGEPLSGPFLTGEAQWDFSGEDGEVTYRFQARSGLSVVVPAGTFTDCLQVTETAIRDGVTLYERQDWYAPGTGRVQSAYVRESALGRFAEERHLLSVSAG